MCGVAAALFRGPKSFPWAYVGLGDWSKVCRCASIKVVAGDAKVDNNKYRARFGVKPHMLTHEDALQYTGHAVGGVCPFAVPDSVPVYLDVSLKRFDTVFPAAGSAASAVRLTCDELERASRSRGWIDVCNGWEEDQ